LIPKRKILSKIYKDFVPKLSESVISEFQLSIQKNTSENLLSMKNTNKVKNNLIQLIGNSRSLSELSTKINDEISDTKIQMSIHYFYIIIVTAVISMSLLILKFVLEIKKTFNKPVKQIENTVTKSKTLENQSESAHESPLTHNSF